MDAVTVLTWLAAGEYEVSPCPGAAWTDLDDAALRKYFSSRAARVCWINLD